MITRDCNSSFNKKMNYSATLELKDCIKNWQFSSQKPHQTAFMKALQNGANPNINVNGITVAVIAVENNDDELLEAAIEHGYDLYQQVRHRHNKTFTNFGSYVISKSLPKPIEILRNNGFNFNSVSVAEVYNNSLSMLYNAWHNFGCNDKDAIPAGTISEVLNNNDVEVLPIVLKLHGYDPSNTDEYLIYCVERGQYDCFSIMVDYFEIKDNVKEKIRQSTHPKFVQWYSSLTKRESTSVPNLKTCLEEYIAYATPLVADENNVYGPVTTPLIGILWLKKNERLVNLCRTELDEFMLLNSNEL